MTATADYSEKIPNNVDLHEDRRLQRALESWQPNFLNWWESMGPTLPTEDVYLRTAVNVGREGGAHFGHAAMKDSRRWLLPRHPRPDRHRRLPPAPRLAGMAEGAGRVPRRPAAADRHPGRHRAGQRRAAAQPRRHRPVALRPAQPLP